MLSAVIIISFLSGAGYAENNRKVKCIAHRGASAYAPENTLASFKKAIEQKADFFECDVHLSKDGEVVVIHDDYLERTTNGKGLVKEKTLKELKELDAGSWFFGDYASERIPTLEETLDVAKGKIGVVIEIKNGPFFYKGIEGKVVDLIKKKEMVDDVIVISFDHASLKKIKKIAPKIKTGVLYYGNILNAPAVARAAGARQIAVGHELATEKLIKDAHKNNMEVNLWTIDDPQTMKKFIDMGVDAITTNKPDVLLEVLEGKD
ncbi:MAG: glycerophosphodiester phosphodiesterase [Candidatus Eremiobacteraeota bacterium]|nr:glycerophosphodiester phosphodiesterase [Candidatus Eremiobacteraeota bacterium]